MTSPEVYSQRRQQLIKLLGSGVVVLPPNPETIYSHDKHYKYRYNSNLIYFSGIKQQETVLVIDVDQQTSYLFILEENKEREKWDGKRISPHDASQTSGIKLVRPLGELESTLDQLSKLTSSIYFQQKVHNELDEIIEHLAMKYQFTTTNPIPAIDSLRVIKQQVELDLLQQSVNITVDAHLAAIQQTREGMAEYQMEAIYKFEFQYNGGIMPMHQATIAAGENAIYLHHRAGNKKLLSGELVLVDTGCEYQGYNADVARTWPVNGEFTKAQRELYEIVLQAHKACIAMIKPGVKFWDIHMFGVEMLVEGLLTLVLLSGDTIEVIEKEKYKRFFMHGIGHFLGLDGHDCSSIKRTEVVLKPGMVFTIEPGLYIPTDTDIPEQYRGIGIRVEDNIVVTADGYLNLSEKLPIEIEEIEQLVGKMVTDQL